MVSLGKWSANGGFSGSICVYDNPPRQVDTESGSSTEARQKFHEANGFVQTSLKNLMVYHAFISIFNTRTAINWGAYRIWTDWHGASPPNLKVDSATIASFPSFQKSKQPTEVMTDTLRELHIGTEHGPFSLMISLSTMVIFHMSEYQRVVNGNSNRYTTMIIVFTEMQQIYES